ncbi:23S rRNA pseudouridine1911/1915/1917 synthase [Bacillus sp. OV166]|uniref:RluA family pseudouridine synthase n=1 Tax=unclassified Bacillus (in: firmicutes) TaxID=185979 RepID=UPI000A2AB5D2|nr:MULTISPECIES: RluA family pseudouridine synthase [unclassified Bacillus (in: firmicutes)]PGY11340.1 pseudouridine synthase [Bacillus sp. AFS031507]SMQ68412.1 23S rRNA pseudouridine1911/1915/1917 synthase [Bacillus sp. OV166]
MTSPFQMKWKISESDSGKLLREFLKKEEISRTALTDIKFKGGSIQVNGEEVNVRYRLAFGDEVMVIFPMESPSEGLKGEEIPLTILYEDKYLLVVNKPAGMNTIPSREHPVHSLANALVGYYQRSGLQATTHIVTRLDRDTSGIVLIAKHRHVHHLFSLMQRGGQVKRTYEAFAGGWISLDSGTITAPIGRKEDSIIEREVRADGQYACTHYQVIEKHIAFTYLELTLETGRTHQIRVHMSYLNHPLLGDDLYGGDLTLIARQALHCKRIKFIHPFSGEEMIFTAPLPRDMSEILEADSLL